MKRARVPRPAEWVRPAPYPWPSVRSLAPGDDITACYAIHEIERLDNALLLTLGDAGERVRASIAADEDSDWLRPGLYVGVRGEIGADGETIAIATIEPLRVTLDDLALFLPSSPRDALEMEAELAAAIDTVTDSGLRALLDRLLSSNAEAGQGFRLAPAANRQHHAYLGGLLEHTLSVTAMCRIIAEHYGASIDHDLLITAALLHDIGKVRELGAGAGFPYTDEGRLLGHILLGLQMVHEAAAGLPIPADRVLLLEHLIAAHQGRYEWQSPREPRIVEALILHYADDLDAKVARASEALAGIDSGWTRWDRSLHAEWLRHSPHGEDTPAEAALSRSDRKTKPKQPATPRKRQRAGGKSRSRRKPDRASDKKKAARSKRPAAPGRDRDTGSSHRRKPIAPRDRDEPSPAPPLPMDPNTLDLFDG